MSDERLTDEELAEIEHDAHWQQEHPYDAAFDGPEILRLVAEVRRLRSIAACRGCLAGYRLTTDHVHYDDSQGGLLWGVCDRWVTEVMRRDRLRLRSDEWLIRAAEEMEEDDDIIGGVNDRVAILKRHRDGAP